MARTAIPVCRLTLEAAVAKVEQNGPLATMNGLAESVATEYNATAPGEFRHIAFSTVLLRIKEWRLETKTRPGKRGRKSMSPEQKEAMREGRGRRTPKAEKMQSSPALRASLNAMVDSMEPELQERFAGTIERVKQGSRSAAVALNCLNCSGYSTAEVRKCVCVHCPLWAFRPYQNETTNDTIMEVVAGRLSQESLDGVIPQEEREAA